MGSLVVDLDLGAAEALLHRAKQRAPAPPPPAEIQGNISSTADIKPQLQPQPQQKTSLTEIISKTLQQAVPQGQAEGNPPVPSVTKQQPQTSFFSLPLNYRNSGDDGGALWAASIPVTARQAAGPQPKRSSNIVNINPPSLSLSSPPPPITPLTEIPSIFY